MVITEFGGRVRSDSDMLCNLEAAISFLWVSFLTCELKLPVRFQQAILRTK